MRMRRNLQKTYHLKRKTTAVTDEGGRIPAWESPIGIRATVWQAQGRMQAEMYGERLTYMKNMEYEGTLAINEGDGICVNVSDEQEPDYIVVSANNDHWPRVFLLEKRI